MTRLDQVKKAEPARILSIVSMSLENRFMIRPSGYGVQWSAGGESSRVEDAHRSLKKRHWTVHNAANSILLGRQVEERLRDGGPT